MNEKEFIIMKINNFPVLAITFNITNIVRCNEVDYNKKRKFFLFLIQCKCLEIKKCPIV